MKNKKYSFRYYFLLLSIGFCVCNPFTSLVFDNSSGVAFAAEPNSDVKTDNTETSPSESTQAEASVQDQTVKSANQESATPIEKSSREMRKEVSYFVLGTYSPLDLLIPSKYGATLGYSQSAESSWELEYLKGSVSLPPVIEDIGEMSEQRISLIRRSYAARNSFYLSAGLSYFDFKVHIGDELLNRVTAGSYPSIDVLRVQALGFHTSLGNRWMFGPNVVVGVDWISWSQPVYAIEKDSAILDYATDPEDREDIEDAMDAISYFPRLAFLKLQIGIAF